LQRRLDDYRARDATALNNGTFDQQRADLLVKFVVESGRAPPTVSFWTNEHVERSINSSN
jgi:hypothetical protein